MPRLINADELWKHKFKSASEKMDLDVVYMSGWNDAIDSIVENAPTVDAKPIKHGEWIPCSERLPDKEGSYLCTVGADYRNPREMIYAPNNFSDNENTWKCPDGYYVFNWFVIAWMPIPKPFKENEVEE